MFCHIQALLSFPFCKSLSLLTFQLSKENIMLFHGVEKELGTKCLCKI